MASPFLVPGISAGVGLVGSLLDRSGEVDPRLNELINALVLRSRQGLSDPARRAHLQSGNEAIGASTTAELDRTRRNLSRIGAGNSSLASTLAGNRARDAHLSGRRLARDTTLLDEQIKGDAFGQLINALQLKSGIDQSNKADFGGLLGRGLSGLQLAELLKSGGAGGKASGQGAFDRQLLRDLFGDFDQDVSGVT